MIYFLRYFEKEVQVTIVITVLFLWAMTSSIYALTKSDETLLIQMNGFDTRIIEESERPPIEIENFLHYFVGLFYSYTSKNYEEHINRAAVLLSHDLVNEFSPKLNAMFDKVSSTPISQNSFIEKILKIKDMEYEIDLSVVRRENDNENSNNYKIRLKVDRVGRSKENPYGLKISNLKEIYE